jgi:hypothetical protein
MESAKVPMFSRENFKKFTINPEIKDEILATNSEFLVETQKYVISQIVNKIHASVKDRHLKLDDQEFGLHSVVQLRVYSFMHYLRCI